MQHTAQRVHSVYFTGVAHQSREYLLHPRVIRVAAHPAVLSNKLLALLRPQRGQVEQEDTARRGGRYFYHTTINKSLMSVNYLCQS